MGGEAVPQPEPPERFRFELLVLGGHLGDDARERVATPGRVAEIRQQVAGERAHVVGPVFRRRGQRFRQHRVEIRRNRGLVCARGRHPGLLDLEERPFGGVRRERDRAREQLEDERAQRPDIGSCVDLFAAQLFRRHEAERTARADRLSRGVRERGDAEVGDLHQPGACDEHVLGLQVEMQDAVLMGEGDRIRHLRHDRGGLVRIEWGVEREEFSERHPVDVFHDEERLVVVGVPLVDGDDVRVVEQRRGPGLFQAGRARQDLDPAAGDRDPLDRHPAGHLRVEREVDGAMASLTEFGERPVPTQDEPLVHAPPALVRKRPRPLRAHSSVARPHRQGTARSG